MIVNIIRLSNISVKEIIVPRVDVVSIDSKSEIDDIIKIVDEKGHSRLPVFNENIDNIVGILHSKDLLKYFTRKSDFKISKIMRSPLFIPESKMINDLLVELREKKNHLAIVVDEYGGMSGIVCLEDIIEKIVGEIQDEFDDEVEDVIQLEENTFLINARITIEELNEKLGTDFHEEEIDTLGGLIFMIFGKIPIKNEKIKYNNYIFTVEAISGRTIKTIKMQILKDE
ncbi:MAG: HlyC/CorC family transporter [Spirochaetes bacterium]|nr:HlyC/CorC family transporter [Spirochaetota bacterium]